MEPEPVSGKISFQLRANEAWDERDEGTMLSLHSPSWMNNTYNLRKKSLGWDVNTTIDLEASEKTEIPELGLSRGQKIWGVLTLKYSRGCDDEDTSSIDAHIFKQLPSIFGLQGSWDLYDMVTFILLLLAHVHDEQAFPVLDGNSL